MLLLKEENVRITYRKMNMLLIHAINEMALYTVSTRSGYTLSYFQNIYLFFVYNYVK